MPQRPSAWNGIARTFKQQLSALLPPRDDSVQEAQLYYRRACLAAAEERYDVSLIFCAKALEIEPTHLPTRLLLAQVYDRGLNDLDAAVGAYRKVIALAAYEGENPYCAAARAGLNALVSTAGPTETPERPEARGSAG
jgi:tetratricopeptide (TPR) repeat protein